MSIADHLAEHASPSDSFRAFAERLLAGRPAHDGPVRRGQAWHWTDRQVRGAILQTLRERPDAVPRPELAPMHEDSQVDRCLGGLIEDGLVEPVGADRYALPGLTEASA